MLGIDDQSIKVIDCGLVPYLEALAIQLNWNERVGSDEPDVLLCFEHPTVLTLGKNARREFILQSSEELAAEGIAIAETDRGGEVTAHEPGQLVFYPILNMRRRGMGPKKLVMLLEEAVIQLLMRYGLSAKRDQRNPGVWVNGEKICSIGIRIRQRVSMHGLALNVNNGLEVFQRIVPCGIRGAGATSVARCMGSAAPSLVEVRHDLIEILLGLLTQKNFASFIQ